MFKLPAKLNTIGQRLSYLMETRGMRQTDLAEACDITQAAVSNLITSDTRKPNATTLMRIAAALQANPLWLLTGEGEPFEVAKAKGSGEKEMLETFRALSPSAQAGLLAAAKAMRGED